MFRHRQSRTANGRSPSIGLVHVGMWTQAPASDPDQLLAQTQLEAAPPRSVDLLSLPAPWYRRIRCRRLFVAYSGMAVAGEEIQNVRAHSGYQNGLGKAEALGSEPCRKCSDRITVAPPQLINAQSSSPPPRL